MGAVQSVTGHVREKVNINIPLYLLDTMNDTISTEVHQTLSRILQTDFPQYTLKKIDKIASVTEKQEIVIIVCRKVAWRLEQMLDYYLNDYEESRFEKILVVIVHDNSPRVSSKSKLIGTERYKKLENIIDVGYNKQTPVMKLFTNNPNIIFGEELLKQFIRNYDYLNKSSRKDENSHMNRSLTGKRDECFEEDQNNECNKNLNQELPYANEKNNENNEGALSSSDSESNQNVMDNGNKGALSSSDSESNQNVKDNGNRGALSSSDSESNQNVKDNGNKGALSSPDSESNQTGASNFCKTC